MTDLLARLREATEGSDALDHEIAAAVGRPIDYEADGNYGPYRIVPSKKRFSRSLDAALTLLGDGWEYSLSTLYGIAYAEFPLNCSDTIPPASVRRMDGNIILAVVECALLAQERTGE